MSYPWKVHYSISCLGRNLMNTMWAILYSVLLIIVSWSWSFEQETTQQFWGWFSLGQTQPGKLLWQDRRPLSQPSGIKKAPKPHLTGYICHASSPRPKWITLTKNATKISRILTIKKCMNIFYFKSHFVSSLSGIEQ